MAAREFDPGLDTPTAYQPGAGQPVPGSPVWEDARRREQINQEQRQAEIEAANNPQRVDEGGQPATNPATPADESTLEAKQAEVDTDVVGKDQATEQKAARATRAEKAATTPKNQAKGDK